MLPFHPACNTPSEMPPKIPQYGRKFSSQPRRHAQSATTHSSVGSFSHHVQTVGCCCTGCELSRILSWIWCSDNHVASPRQQPPSDPADIGNNQLVGDGWWIVWILTQAHKRSLKLELQRASRRQPSSCWCGLRNYDTQVYASSSRVSMWLQMRPQHRPRHYRLWWWEFVVFGAWVNTWPWLEPNHHRPLLARSRFVELFGAV